MVLGLVALASCGKSAGRAHDHEGHDHGVEAVAHDHAREGHDHEAEVAAHGTGASDEIVVSPEKAEAAGIVVETVRPAAFREVIATSGQVLPVQGSERTLVANVAGVVSFPRPLVEGMAVQAQAPLLTLSSAHLQDGDPAERARIAYETAKTEYERAQRLVDDRIVSQKDFNTIRERYENARLAYEALLPSGNGQGDSTQGKGQSAAGTEDLRKEELDKYATDADVSQAVAEAKQELAQAAQGARLSGKLSGPVSQLVDKTLSTKVPGRSVLERFMTSKADQHRSWNRPNKRFMPRFYLPRRERMPAMGKLVVGIDVSGSVSDEEIARYLGAVNEIIEVCPPEEIYVVYATTHVEHVDHYMRDDYPIKAKPFGSRGGTDLRCIMRWMEKEDVNADLCVVFTDGCTPYPSRLPCETIWAITYRGVTSVPIGEYLEVTNE